MWMRTLITNGDHLVALCDIRYNENATPSIVYDYNLITDTTSKNSGMRMRQDYKRIDGKCGLYEYNSNTKE